MPYAIHHKGEKWVVANTETGHEKGRHDTREEAVRQMRLLHGVEHGWKPTGEPAKKAKR